MHLIMHANYWLKFTEVMSLVWAKIYYNSQYSYSYRRQIGGGYRGAKLKPPVSSVLDRIVVFNPFTISKSPKS